MKEDIRYAAKIKRKYFQGLRREYADECIFDNFLNAFGGLESFFIYNSFGTEADTQKIISYLKAAKKRVYLPRVEGENIVPVPLGETKSGAYGIKEPTGQAFTGDIDVTIIPLLAVNRRGYRIGYGGGYYDRYLKDAKTLKVGLCYDFQIANFDEDGWDKRLDRLLTEKGIYHFGDT